MKTAKWLSIHLTVNGFDRKISKWSYRGELNHHMTFGEGKIVSFFFFFISVMSIKAKRVAVKRSKAVSLSSNTIQQLKDVEEREIWKVARLAKEPENLFRGISSGVHHSTTAEFEGFFNKLHPRVRATFHLGNFSLTRTRFNWALIIINWFSTPFSPSSHR